MAQFYSMRIVGTYVRAHLQFPSLIGAYLRLRLAVGGPWRTGNGMVLRQYVPLRGPNNLPRTQASKNRHWHSPTPHQQPRPPRNFHPRLQIQSRPRRLPTASLVYSCSILQQKGILQHLPLAWRNGLRIRRRHGSPCLAGCLPCS
jgi:hypothetical protein